MSNSTNKHAVPFWLTRCALASCLIFACSVLNGQSNARFDFPYQAFVLHDNATVHSGPGQLHYATQAMTQGAVVEVYRHDPGGWCAIRPIAESFSLVPESTLEIISDGVGQVTENGTQAWVGTKLGTVDKPLWQVKLQKGEKVEVLGQVSWPSPEGHSTVWYQIAPPAGEFRWIRMSDIQLPAAPIRDDVSQPIESQTVRSLYNIDQGSTISASPPAFDRATSMANTHTESAEPSTHNGGLRNDNLIQQVTLQTEQPVRQTNLGWRQATRPITTAPVGGFTANNEAFNQNFENEPSGIRSTNSTMTRSPNRFANADLSTPNLANEMKSMLAARQPALPSLGSSSRKNLSDLELELTHEMLKQPAQWNLNDLETAALASFRTATGQRERSAAEKFMTKLENCKQIQSGYATLTGGKSGFVSNPSLNSQQTIGTGIAQDVQLGTTYDAHGWLTELVRDGGSSQSTYALQDATGKITHHVSPAPGMNLHRYLKKRIGIIGKRGYHSQLKLDHVTAARVIELQEPTTIRR